MVAWEKRCLVWKQRLDKNTITNSCRIAIDLVAEKI